MSTIPLPPIDALRARSQALAMLDAILCPEWQYRYYSFNSRWAPDQQMASMRNGQGDGYFVLFHPAGVALKGLAHELPRSVSAQHLFVDLPAALADFAREPAFSIADTTFCAWRLRDEPAWSFRSAVPANDGGAADLLALLREDAASYASWASGYFEVPVPVADVEHVSRHGPLSNPRVARLNPSVSLDALRRDIDEIGYPALS